MMYPHPPSTTEVASVLRSAAALIEERGWSQGLVGDCLCAQVAIATAAELQGSDRDEQRALSFSAQAMLVSLWGLSEGSPAPLIFSWNDAPGRTQEEVTTALREAAVKTENLYG